MPLTAFLVVGTISFTSCEKKEEVPEQEPAVVDTLMPPANVDTLVIDTAGTGTEVKVMDPDSGKAASGRKGTKTQSTNKEMHTSPDGNTGTKKPQREDNTSTAAPTTNEPVKTESPTNTTAKKPQRP